jgi:hypothetical protein
MTEKEIEAYFVKRVKALGGYAYKFRSVTQRGVADRIACLPNGQTWFVELKKPGGRLSALQEVFAEEMAKTKQNYVCLWSKAGVDEWADHLN